MARKMIMAAVAVALAMPATMEVPAFGKDRRAHSYDRGRHDYRYRCKRSNGTTGTVVGGAGGALAANALGAGTVGTIAGGVGGALLGRHVDKRQRAAKNRRNGC